MSHSKMEQAGDVSSSGTKQGQEMDPMQAAAIGLVELRNFLTQAVNEIDAAQVEQYLNEPDLDVPHNTPCDEAEMNALLDDDDPVGEDALNKDQDREPAQCLEKTTESLDQSGNEESIQHPFTNEEHKMELDKDEEDEGIWLRKPQGKQSDNEESIGGEAKEALIVQEGREHDHALLEEPREEEQIKDDDETPLQLRCLASKTKGGSARKFNTDESDDDDVMIVDEIPKKTEICSICGRESKSLKHHYGLFHPKKRYNPLVSCPICGRPKIHKNNLGRHLIMHKGPRAMRCVLCPAIFMKHAHLLEHMEAEHQKED